MTGTAQFICYICNRPIDLHTSKTDDRGRAIHEECYVVATLLRMIPLPSKVAENSLQGRIEGNAFWVVARKIQTLYRQVINQKIST